MIKKELCKEILQKLVELKEKDSNNIVYIERYVDELLNNKIK